MMRLLILAALPLACGSSIASAQPPQGDLEEGPKPVVVGKVIRVREELPTTKKFIGTVVPERHSVVGSAVDGRVEQLFVDEGDFVPTPSPDAPMPPLVQLRTKTIEIDLAAARAEENLRMHELEELKRGFLPEEVCAAQAKMRGAQATWKFAEARLKRTSELFRQNRSATAEQLDEAIQEETAAEQAFIVTQAELKLVEDGPREERVQQAKARLDQAQQSVLRLEDMKQKYTIRAPFEGFIVAKHTELGAWISQGDPVVEIIKLDVVDVDVSVPEADVRKLRRGDAVLVRFEALGKDALHEGVIWQIIPQADPRSRTFPVKVRIGENPDYPRSPQIKAGMLAEVVLPVSFQAGLFVPKDALVLNRGSKSLFVVRSDSAGNHVVDMVPVELGDSQQNLIQVIDSQGVLREGDLVVIRGNERLRPRDAVAIQRDDEGKEN